MRKPAPFLNFLRKSYTYKKSASALEDRKKLGQKDKNDKIIRTIDYNQSGLFVYYRRFYHCSVNILRVLQARFQLGKEKPVTK